MREQTDKGRNRSKNRDMFGPESEKESGGKTN